MASIERKLVHGVGFSNGCAALALKNPPPLVPSCLIASWLATGPMARTCFAPSSVVAVTYGWRFWITPACTNSSARTNDSGRNRYSVPRTRSTQKLPILPAERRAMPRASATAAATPHAADMKLWKASCIICER